jgi:hypothetical protein
MLFQYLVQVMDLSIFTLLLSASLLILPHLLFEHLVLLDTGIIQDS